MPIYGPDEVTVLGQGRLFGVSDRSSSAAALLLYTVLHFTRFGAAK
jgi:hypothetical protein